MPVTRLKIFVSSVQKEFESIRKDLKTFLLGDAVLRRFISEVFLFEELPAADRRADEVYLEAVEQCHIYIGLFGYEYGRKDAIGFSPTEREYDHATQCRKARLIYVWGSNESRRDSAMKKLVNKASSDLIRRRIEDFSALTSEVYASLVDHLDRSGALRVPPFDAAACDRAMSKDLSRKRVSWFLETARRERGFPLKAATATPALLKHLNLTADHRPTNAAVLLFDPNPQKYLQRALIQCTHCHGTKYQRPFASFQVYGGDLFEQADQARDFVLSKINRTIGTRAKSNVAPAAYELPPDAVGEAIINAIAHRDYHSNASVEVRLFADRLEVWNPGSLPGTLNLEDLRHDHASVPNNPLIAEPLYLARYIERAGSGTQTMIELCLAAGLPEPSYEQRSGFFVATLWRDRLTAEVLAELSLTDRQLKAVAYVKANGKLTSGQYQEITGVEARTATRDLVDLVEKRVFSRHGQRRSVYYTIRTQ